MRVLSRHLTALDRQVEESVNILEAGKVPEESLNSKNEWGGAKIPSLLVSSPKGVAENVGDRKQSQETDTHEHLEGLRKAIARGQKRIRYRELDPDQANVTLEQENLERNPRKRRKGNAAADRGQEMDEMKSPEPEKEKRNQQSPKTFTELKLNNTEGNWNEVR